MEEGLLRLILLGVGIVILVGIYLQGRPKKEANKEEFEESRPERVFKGMPAMSSGASVADDASENREVGSEHKIEPETESEKDSWFDYKATEPEPEPEFAIENNDGTEQPKKEDDWLNGLSDFAETPSEEVEDHEINESAVIQLAVVPTYGDKIKGVDLLNACAEFDLEFGDMGIFHRYHRHEGVETQVFHVANVVEPGTFPIGEMGSFETIGIALFMQAADEQDAQKVFDEMLETARLLSISLDAELVDDKMQSLSVEQIEAIRGQLARLTG